VKCKYFETNKVMKRKYLETEVGTYQHNSDQIFIGMLVNDIFPGKKIICFYALPEQGQIQQGT